MRHFVLLLLLATSARGGDFIVKNFRFHNAETFPEVRIHYATFGTPRPGNAVLILHGTAGSPTHIAGRNRIWRKMMIDDLQRGDVTSAVQILMLVGSAPLQWQKTAPTRDDADRWLAEQMKTRMATTNADDLLYALEASRNYDPSPQLEKIKAPLLAINSADDFINPPELGIMEKLIARVPRGRYVLIPTSEQTHGHSTHTWAAVWGGELAKFLGGRILP